MSFQAIYEHLCSDNGPEMTAKWVRNYLLQFGAEILLIEPSSPWENDYNKSVNGNLGDELLNDEIFYSRQKAQIIFEQWRIHYNTKQPHFWLGY